MASSLLTISGTIPTHAVVRSVLSPIGSSLPSVRLTRPCNKPTFFISCYTSVSNKAAISATDLKPIVERWPEYVPNKLPENNYVRVFDTTLRDGEQAPGGALTPQEKLEIARQLAKLRVDIMEVGFPGSSEEELETIKTIAKTVGNEVDEETGYVPVIGAIARCKQRDIEAAWEALKYAKRPRICLFTSTSDIHMKYKLKKTKEEVIEMAMSSIRFAKSLGFIDIQLGCEDGGRSEKEFLCKILGESIKEGATTVGIADTVGINMPQEFGELVAYLKANTPRFEDVVFAIHCHNDLGLATANAIAGVSAGARHVEVTINGIGERSGNTPLEEFVMALKCRGAYMMDGLYTRIDTRQIMPTSKMVQEYSGLYVQPHKPIVGANCFVHESGIHQDGILKNQSTYKILSPEDVGIVKSQNSGIVLGKLSGRHAVKDRLKELGYEIGDEKLNDIFSRFKNLTKQKKGVSAGERHVEVTINGIGERSGNTPLEEFVMALKCRGAYMMDGLYTRIDTRQIMPTSKMVQEYSGLYVQPHKPIVGANCFVHESGIHQDGILKNRSTYEILSPEDVGIVKSQNSGIVFGKLSGRHAVKDRLKELGYEIGDEKLNDISHDLRI